MPVANQAGVRSISGVLLGFSTYLLTSLASAAPTVSQAPQEPELPPLEEERHWYGWQTLSLDGGAAALGLAALAVEASDSPVNEILPQALLFGGGLAYVAGAPTIHFLHKRRWQALGSFGLRAGLPVLGGAIAYGVTTCPYPGATDYGSCGLGELILGAAAGTLAAIILDNSLLPWEKADSEASQARLGLAPVISSDGRRELRVFGTF